MQHAEKGAVEMEFKETDEKLRKESEGYLEELKKMRGGNLAPFQKRIANNPALLKQFVDAYRQGYNDNFVIPRKYVELIMMVLGASRGAMTTIKAHGNLAVKNGATLEEVAEVMRLVFFACGVTSLIPASELFALFDEDDK
jgi:alkylhydroperoxidase/carboxymuconolactone decarboxylase family protein YurZ